MEYAFLFTGIAIGFALAYLYNQRKSASTEVVEAHKQLETQNRVLEERISMLQQRSEATEQALIIEREKNLLATDRLARAEVEFRKQKESLEDQKKTIEEVQKKFTLEFENVASKLLEEKSQKFTDQNRTNLDIVLNPLKERLKEFEQKVDNSYRQESAERNSLKGEINKLLELNKVVMEEAGNLSRALKGDTKVQGNWGELILEKVLERSGLEKDREYKLQYSARNDDQKLLRPDVIVLLPDDKHIIIDSKVSLTAYEKWVNEPDMALREQWTKEHLASLKSHIASLSNKDYPSLTGLQAPDFTLLFIPIEASFSMAVQADHDLFGYAWDRRIVLVSPSTLLATLRTVSSIWKQDRQNKNALRIAEEGGKLYDKFVDFVKEMETLGDRLRQAQHSYDTSMNRLSTGKGNLITRTEQLKHLGAKTSKSLGSQSSEDPASPIL